MASGHAIMIYDLRFAICDFDWGMGIGDLQLGIGDLTGPGGVVQDGKWANGGNEKTICSGRSAGFNWAEYDCAEL
jgi:hypothetical protein